MHTIAVVSTVMLLLCMPISAEGVDWCPAKRSPDAHWSGKLRIASWNLANLHAENGKSVYTGRRRSEVRENADYERIKCYVRLFDPDILAVQEVDGEKALGRVVDSDVYSVHVSSRPKGGLNGKQNTGFAYKKWLMVQELNDLKALDVSNGKLRYGAQIRVRHNGRSFKMLSVHMKSGCFDDTSSGRACTKLFQQVPKLEEWIDSEANSDEPFIILGDFNRRLNIDGDGVWEEINDGRPPNANLENITKNKTTSCRDNSYERFIDHAVFDRRSYDWVEDSSFRHITYRQADKDVWGQISDHCPIAVDLWIR